MAKLGGVRNKAEMHIIFGPVSYQYVRSALALDRSCCSLDCRRADKARPPTLHGIGTPARAPHYRGEWVIDHFVIAPIASPAMKRICPQSLPPRYVYTTTPTPVHQYILLCTGSRRRASCCNFLDRMHARHEGHVRTPVFTRRRLHRLCLASIVGCCLVQFFFSRFLITSNLVARIWNSKYR